MLSSLDGLRAFLEAARHLNFRRAARALSITPGALGKRIQQLEAELDAALFHRTTRLVELTPAGRALLPHAEAILERVAEAARAAQGAVGPAPIELTLGTRQELGVSWVLPMLDDLRAALPHATIHLYFGSGVDLEGRVRGREIDCAISSRPLNDARLDAARLHREDYVFVAAPALLARLPFSRPEDSVHHTLIDINDELALFRYWRDAPEGEGLRFARLLKMGTLAAIKHQVLQGEGVAVIPRYIAGSDLATRRLEVLQPRVTPLCDHFRLFFRADDPKRAVYERLAAVMREHPLR